MASASLLENLITSLTSEGFSKEAAERIARSVKNSTIKNYQSKWRIFCDWCRSNGHDPASPKITDIAEFLIFLKDVKSLDPITIKGYRAMLSNTFQTSLDSIGSNPQLSNLVRNFAISTQKAKRKIPS